MRLVRLYSLFLLCPWLFHLLIPIGFVLPVTLLIGNMGNNLVAIDALSAVGTVFMLLAVMFVIRHQTHRDSRSMVATPVSEFAEEWSKFKKSIVESSAVQIVATALLFLGAMISGEYVFLSLLGEPPNTLSSQGVFSLLAVGLVAPVLEEYIFRKRFFQFAASENISRVWLHNLIIFMLYHSYSLSIVDLVFAARLSTMTIVFIIVYQSTESYLWTSIIHVASNILVIGLALYPSYYSIDPNNPSIPIAGFVCLTLFILAVFLFVWLRIMGVTLSRGKQVNPPIRTL